MKENDTSAVGAVMLAMVGDGLYETLCDAIRASVDYHKPIKPTGAYREVLAHRFVVYRRLYKDLKETFELFNKGDKT